MTESESIQTARLAAWPELRTHYSQFSSEILQGFRNPAEKAVAETLLGENRPWDGRPANPEEIEEAVILRTKAGSATTSGGTRVKIQELAQALQRISGAWQRCAARPENEKENEEKSFKAWLEKIIFEQAAEAEPSFLESEGPIQKALERLEALRAHPLFYSKREATICFPMENFELAWKPKLVTGLSSFDENELDGGVEEDTVMILAGETNIGKSHLGLHCLSTISLHRLPVLLCSGEDSIEMTKRRVFAHYLRRTSAHLIDMTECQREREFASLYGDRDDPNSLHHHIRKKVGITCIEEGKFTPERLREKIDEFEQQTGEKTAAVMGDYLQKMNESRARSRSARDEELERVVNELKEISQTRKTFTILISQIPSHAAGGSSEFLNLRQAVARSYAATWGAHYIVTMNRTAEETRRLATSTDKRPRLNLFLCKAKDGPLGVCHLIGNPAEARWDFFRTKAERDLALGVTNRAGNSRFEPESYRR